MDLSNTVVPGQEPSERRVRCSSNVVSRVIADEAVVVPIRSGAGDLNSIYSFNDAGTKLWSMLEKGLEGGQTAAQLALYLQETYGITGERARSDIDNFLAELAEEGLIERA